MIFSNIVIPTNCFNNIKMAITGNLAKIAAASIFIFLVNAEKWAVNGQWATDCAYGDYPCDDGKKCYTEEQRCDDRKDCDDNSDEDNHHCGIFLI